MHRGCHFNCFDELNYYCKPFSKGKIVLLIAGSAHIQKDNRYLFDSAICLADRMEGKSLHNMTDLVAYNRQFDVDFSVFSGSR